MKIMHVVTKHNNQQLKTLWCTIFACYYIIVYTEGCCGQLLDGIHMYMPTSITTSKELPMNNYVVCLLTLSGTR